MSFIFVVMGMFSMVLVLAAMARHLHATRSRTRPAGQRTAQTPTPQNSTPNPHLPDVGEIADPREAAAILLACVAQAGELPPVTAIRAIATLCRAHFELDSGTAGELAQFAFRMAQKADDPFAPVPVLGRVLHAHLTHRELMELETMLHHMARTGGDPNTAQKALCDEVALKAGM